MPTLSVYAKLWRYLLVKNWDTTQISDGHFVKRSRRIGKRLSIFSLILFSVFRHPRFTVPRRTFKISAGEIDEDVELLID